MPSYFVFFLDTAGQIRARRELAGASLDAAKEAAERLLLELAPSYPRAEIWDGTRRLAAIARPERQPGRAPDSIADRPHGSASPSMPGATPEDIVRFLRNAAGRLREIAERAPDIGVDLYNLAAQLDARAGEIAARPHGAAAGGEPSAG